MKAIAQRIVEGNISESLRDHEILSVDAKKLLNDCTCRAAMEEIKSSNAKIIFFVPNPPNFSLLDIIDDFVIPSGCRVITVLPDKNPGNAKFFSTFERVEIQHPSSIEYACEALKETRRKYEAHHSVSIADSALVEAMAFATERHKDDDDIRVAAMDMIDDAAAKFRLDILAQPRIVHEIEGQLANLRVKLGLFTFSTKIFLIIHSISIYKNK